MAKGKRGGRGRGAAAEQEQSGRGRGAAAEQELPGRGRGAASEREQPGRGRGAADGGQRDLEPPLPGLQSLSLTERPAPSPPAQAPVGAWQQPRASAWGQPGPAAPSAAQPAQLQAKLPVGMPVPPPPRARGPPQKVGPAAGLGQPAVQPQQKPAPQVQQPQKPTPQMQQPPVTKQAVSGAAGGSREPEKAITKEKPSVYSKGTYNKYIGSLTPVQLPNRPDKGGTSGKRIKLFANHFKLEFGKNKHVYHYDVEIFDGTRPMVNKAMRRTIVFRLLNDPARAQVFPRNCCVFDGMKNLYANQRLNIKGVQRFEVTVEDDGRDREFAVEVQYATDVNLDTVATYLRGGQTEIPQQGIQAMDIILRYNQTYNMSYLPVQRSLFDANRPRIFDLGGGALVWSGHFQSVRMGTHLFLNVDSSQKAMHKDGPVVDVMYDVLELDQNYDPRPLDSFQREKFAKYLKGLKVQFRVGNVKRDYRVNGLAKSARQEKFDNEGKEMTVLEYFKQRYNMSLKYPDLECLWVGNPNKRIVVPMEFCAIKPGQVLRGKLSGDQTSKMIRAAAKPPAERMAVIEEAVRKMNVNRDPVAQSFGFSMSDRMTEVEGRILPPPVLEYNQRKEIRPVDGKWDMRQARFLESAGLRAWGVLNTARLRPDDLPRFLETLKMKAGQLGMAVENQLFVENCRDSPADVERKLKELKQKYPMLKLILVPISKKGAEIYKDIKRVGDLIIHVTTQCATVMTISKCQDQTIANLLMKINAKLGGVNNWIARSTLPEILHEPVLILGADVTHPSPDQRREGKPSIAAVVGNADARAMKYYSQLRLQEPGKEIIEELEDMVYQLILKFRDVNVNFNDGKPRKIIFYRDGVSEGQFAEVLRWEFNAVRRACHRLHPEYSPTITFLVVQKRHNTRLFAQRGEPTVGRQGNIPPGTVVDTVITHAKQFDYFLCSHEGIQGTSRPTHYHVLFDENGFTSDKLETLTYYLCHLFARCTRSVSNPAPSYYAHLLAFRGRHHHDSLTRSGNPSPAQLMTLVEQSSRTESMFYV